VDQLINRSDDSRSESDATMIMLSRVLDGSLSALATYHLLKADVLRIRGLPEAPSRPMTNGR